MLRTSLIALVGLLLVGGSMACGSCGCSLVEEEGCLCEDASCQLGGSECGPNGSALPSCTDLCVDHGGAIDGGQLPNCSSRPLTPFDGGPSRSDGGLSRTDAGLYGPHGFEIMGWGMSPAISAATCGLVGDVLADGGLAAVGVSLFSSFTTEMACLNPNESVAAHPGYALTIVLGTSEFVDANLSQDGGPQPQTPLAPGIYKVENEGISDEDLCSIDTGYSAVVTEFGFFSDGGVEALYNGAGTITLTAVSSTSLSGRLDVILGSVDRTTPVDGGSLSGDFQARLCP